MRRAAILALVTLPVTALAELPNPYDLERPLDFSLRFTQHDLSLERGGSDIDTTLRRIGIVWRERFGPRLALALHGGYSYVSQDDYPPTAGLELDGYHAGVSLDVFAPLSPTLHAFAGVRYLYEHTEDSTADLDIDLDWNEWSADAGVSVDLGARVRTHVGVNYVHLDGEERLRGSVNSTEPVELGRDVGAFGALELRLEEAGYVGIAGQSGALRGISIYFGRLF